VKRFVISFLMVLLVNSNLVPAYAYIGLCCGKCGGNMPLNILGGGVPETNEFRFKISPMLMRMDGLRNGTDSLNTDNLLGMPAKGKYMAVPTDMNMSMINIAAGYSFTDDFFGGLMFMLKKSEMDMRFNSMMQKSTEKEGYTMRSEGMADSMLMTKYRLYADDPLIPTNQVSLLGGISLPTGSINEKNSTHPLRMRKDELLPYSMQLGSGTFDPKLGILYQGSSSPMWWGANLIYTGRWYENSRDYRLGDEYRLDLYTMYQVHYNTVLELQLNGRYWGKVRGEMDSSASGVSGRATKNDSTSPYMTPLFDSGNYGGSKLSVTAGLEWQPFPLHIIELSVSVPIYQNLNGPQLEEDFRAMLTWYIEFPTSSSVRYTGKKKQGTSRLGF